MFQIDPNITYPRKTESKSLIRFQDCDPLKHLNNAKYFDYFFNAREDHVAEIYQFDLNEYFEQKQTIWVVYNHQIAYMNSAKVSEWVNIITSIVYFNENTKITEYVMTDETKKVLKAVLWTTSKYINTQTGTTTNHQPEIMEYFSHIAAQDVDMKEVTFASRLKIIKKELAEGTFI